jgi:hypothetical protein
MVTVEVEGSGFSSVLLRVTADAAQAPPTKVIAAAATNIRSLVLSSLMGSYARSVRRVPGNPFAWVFPGRGEYRRSP